MIHADLLKTLLPPVSIDPNGQALGAELVAEGSALDTALGRAADILAEADPRTTSELLADWERVAGLPDPCVTVAQTVEQRRAALVSLLTSLGGQSRQYFIDLAASMGYPGATIDEYRPMTCTDDCNDALWSQPDRFAWQINLPSGGGVWEMSCTSPCDSPLAAWGDEAVECRINRYKPAHTTAIFAYV